MPTTVRAALVQATWTGDKESMIKAHEEYAREAAAQGAKVGLLPGTVLRAVLLPGAGREVLRLRRIRARPDGRAVPGARVRARHGHGAARVRAGAAGRPLQHRRGPRRGREVPRQVPQDAHPARERVLGEVLLPAGQPRLSGLRHRGRPGRRVHLLRPALPRGLAGARPQRRRDRVQPVARPAGGCPTTSGSWSSRAPPSPTSTSSARSTGSASRTSATTTSTARPTSSTPEGKPVDGYGSDTPPSSRPGPGHGAARPRSATAGRSTATAARTRTATWCGREDAHPGRHRGQRDRSRPDGRARRRRDDRGAVRARDSGRRGRRRDARRDRQVRHPGRDRRAHAHGDAVRRHARLGHVRDRHDRGGLGRHDHDRGLRRAAHRRGRAGRRWPRGTPRPRATAPSTTAST